MATLIDQFVEKCRTGANPNLVCRVGSGWVVLGDAQFLAGYCLLLADPVVPDLNALSGKSRERFLLDTVAIGDALLEVTESYRINYETLGNKEAALHTHIFPRYMSEDAELRVSPVWSYDWEKAPKFDQARDQELMDKIHDSLRRMGVAT